jgi:integrase
VSAFFHHGAWWCYFREAGRPIRRKVAADRQRAEQVVAQLNAQLATAAPTFLAFSPIAIPDLRREFVAYHEHVLKSSVATFRRYRAATQHLENFVNEQTKPAMAHEVVADTFAAYLRRIEVAPNGHPNTPKRRLRDKGIKFILETCRAMYAFATKRRHLPPYAGNPFAQLPLDRLKIEDSKPVFVFDAETELTFFRAADRWSFPIHFTLATTGVRIGELTHLLVEDLDLHTGWLHVGNKTALGWRVKTGNARKVPLLPEAIALLSSVIGKRDVGPIFLRKRFSGAELPPLLGDRLRLEQVCHERQRLVKQPASRIDLLRVARGVWRDAGAVKADAVRASFIRIMRQIGRPDVTCVKSWRHSFATLMQDANVDPLVRQLTLGHKPTACNGLGMTANYTHTRPETHRQQIEQALRRWPKPLALAADVAERTSFSKAAEAHDAHHQRAMEVQS